MKARRNAVGLKVDPDATVPSRATSRNALSARPTPAFLGGSPGKKRHDAGENDSGSDDDVIDLAGEQHTRQANETASERPSHRDVETRTALPAAPSEVASSSTNSPTSAWLAPRFVESSPAEGLRQLLPLHPTKRLNQLQVAPPATPTPIQSKASVPRVSVNLTVASTQSRSPPSAPVVTAADPGTADDDVIFSSPDEIVAVSPALREFISNIQMTDGSPASLDPQAARRWLGGRNGAPHGMQCDLFDHQAVAVKWMLHMENNTPLSGGLLADDMGMGKTIQTIATMLHNLPSREARKDPSSPKSTLIVAPLALLTQWRQEIYDKVEPDVFRVTIHHGQRRARSVAKLREYDVVLTTYATLCKECPVNEEVATLGDAEDSELGGGRLPASSKRRRGPLLETHWHRIILDEGHAIKNFRTRCSTVVSKLRADHRWILTGTPIQNHLEELFPLFRFLRVKHMEDIRDFRQKVSKFGAEEGSRRAQAILRGIMLRRTKADRKPDGTPLLVMRDKTVYLARADFTAEERGFYEALETKTVETFHRYMKAGTVMKNYSHMLTLLLRLRQACDHVNLVLTAGGLESPASLYLTAAGETIEAVKEELERARRILPERVLQRLLDKYAGGVEDTDATGECPICMDVMTDAVVIRCGHEFCRECISNCIQAPQTNVIDVDDESPRCPLCRGTAKMDHIISVIAFRPRTQPRARPRTWAPIRVCETKSDLDSAARPIQDDDDDDEELPSYDDMRREFFDPLEKVVDSLSVDDPSGIFEHGEYLSSTKIRLLIETLDAYRQHDRSIKTVVFSQFTSMLDLVEMPLTRAGFNYCRYDGKMSMSRRDEAVRKLREDDRTSVMLVSLKCGGVGLNLTRASRVIMLDVWWNPAVEDQAIDRIHRIGQENDVEVQRLIVKGTVEDRIVDLQEKKRQLAKGALGEGDARMGRLTLRDLIYLFGGGSEHRFCR